MQRFRMLTKRSVRQILTVFRPRLKSSLSRDQFRCIQLIWKRFAASRMASAVYETTNVKIGAGNYRFTASASKIAFDGFMLCVYTEADDEKAGKTGTFKSQLIKIQN